jgi:hypothetical protein
MYVRIFFDGYVGRLSGRKRIDTISYTDYSVLFCYTLPEQGSLRPTELTHLQFFSSLHSSMFGEGKGRGEVMLTMLAYCPPPPR